uniref:Uncharacterized protein n=1 Tax=Arundo donax TaxID=35708 RepID=A0A0A8ZZN8_ARUDO
MVEEDNPASPQTPMNSGGGTGGAQVEHCMPPSHILSGLDHSDDGAPR